MDSTILVGIMGHPVSHTLSPDIFRFLAEFLAKKSPRAKTKPSPWLYRKMDVLPQDLRSTVQVLKQIELLRGWNVTIPHKQTMLGLVDELTLEAQAVQAVNVVELKNGKLIGHNTDVYGVEQTLHEQKDRSRRVLLLGAGGAALATAFALAKRGVQEITVQSRTLSRSQDLVQKLQPQFPKTRWTAIEWGVQPEGTLFYDLFINSTPIGMQGFSSSETFEFLKPVFALAGRKALAFDLVYRPQDTLFLQLARKHKLRTVGGLDMLAWQALATFEIWFGKVGKTSAIRQARTQRASQTSQLHELKTHLVKALKRKLK